MPVWMIEFSLLSAAALPGHERQLEYGTSWRERKGRAPLLRRAATRVRFPSHRDCSIFGHNAHGSSSQPICLMNTAIRTVLTTPLSLRRVRTCRSGIARKLRAASVHRWPTSAGTINAPAVGCHTVPAATMPRMTCTTSSGSPICRMKEALGEQYVPWGERAASSPVVGPLARFLDHQYPPGVGVAQPGGGHARLVVRPTTRQGWTRPHPGHSRGRAAGLPDRRPSGAGQDAVVAAL